MEKKLEVKIVSKEMVRPSSPTPPHLKTFTFCLLDQIMPNFFRLPMLLIYNVNPTSSNKLIPIDVQLLIARLKTSLSQTLSIFYPLAGRCDDDCTITCNDRGIPLVEAHVNTSVASFLSSPSKVDHLKEFLPPQELLKDDDQDVHLAFQVNVFECGGVVIGCYFLHKMLDATSLATFLRHWAATTTNIDPSPAQPDFIGPIEAFPPTHEPQLWLKDLLPALDGHNNDKNNITFVGKTFVFSDVALSKLKALAVSKAVPNPTRFEAVTGFIWTHALAASPCLGPGPTQIDFIANLRGTTRASLQNGSMANVVAPMIIQSKDKWAGYLDRVAEIHIGLVNGREDVIADFQKGPEATNAYMKAYVEVMVRQGYDPNFFSFGSWCRVGFKEVDFGFGKPEWIVPSSGWPIEPGKKKKNVIFLTDYTHPISDANGDENNNGIAAWVYLEEKTMQNLLSNSDFLAFASPRW